MHKLWPQVKLPRTEWPDREAGKDVKKAPPWDFLLTWPRVGNSVVVVVGWGGSKE